ncbi:DNA-methyltransferase [Amycolatopsis sp. NPDC059657]|uniref:DNA-methyltransferase n=1 Tax=Amycolatopsis sp. NPDC059657 TaxID=3346899 RepID=UPI00366B55E1
MNQQPTGTIHYRDRTIALYTGDATTTLAGLPEQSVDCVVTSPPHWRLRDYSTRRRIGCNSMCMHVPGSVRDRTTLHADRQHGREPNPRAYVDRLRAVLDEVRRVLADTGTLWLSLVDSYLVGIPWLVAFALQRDGWILRNAIVWNKPTALAEPVRDRSSSRYELLFLLSKQQKYHFNLDAIRQPRIRPAGTARGKNPGDVWSLPTQPQREVRFAAFPIHLPLRCIAAGCPTGGVVLDPFSGAGTTGLAARRLGRRYVGVDLEPEQHEIAVRRLGLPTQQPCRSTA